ncbi:carboxymuconolactone decarboxylase family protein [Candidatus Poribacteria bacterium]|nr:carboxymuconolactone decarboxylase family protein [Candidatus Poribacteria bacterium]
MSRIPYITPENFTEAQQHLFQSITGGKRGEGRAPEDLLNSEGGMSGPFNPWLRSPVLGDAAQRLGETVRFESALPPQLRELGILIVAARWKAQYEWWAHERIARQEGLDEEVIENVKAETLPDFSSPTEVVVYNFARELLDEHRVSDHLYNEAVELLGEAGVTELVILLGYYTLVSMTLNVFEVPVPTGEDAPFVGPENP